MGRVIRDIRRKVEASGIELSEKLEQYLDRANRIFQQTREDKNKVYCMHAPEVECISKGKAHKKYEFGCKVSVVTTSKNSWVVGVDAVHGNPYDGHTLKAAHAQVWKITEVKPEDIFVDKEAASEKISDRACDWPPQTGSQDGTKLFDGN